MSPADLRLDSAEARRAFVLAHTALAPVPFVPELSVHTATEVTALWSATERWLGERGVDVPFWSVPWAGGQALARWVLDHPAEVRGRRVLDLGTGGGLVALAAARAGAGSVEGVDVDPLACEAARLNAIANGLEVRFTCADRVGEAARPLGIDVVLAGDVWYDRAAAARIGPWLRALARGGVRVVTGDPGRSYVPRDLVELARYEVPTTQELESVASRATIVAEVPAGR